MSDGASQVYNRSHAVAKVIIRQQFFALFFMLLTFYAIFGPDMVLLLCPKQTDFSFQIANTVVFLLFLTELILQALGKRGYVYTVMFLLDVVWLHAPDKIRTGYVQRVHQLRQRLLKLHGDGHGATLAGTR